ncbi:hypothetical protein [Nocardia niigatensis]
MKLLAFPSGKPAGPPPDVVAVTAAAELAKDLDWLGLHEYADRARAIAALLGYNVRTVPKLGHDIDQAHAETGGAR